MSVYGDHILPRIIHYLGGTAEIKKLRQQVFGQAEGVILEIGFGSGLSLPFYSGRVKKLLAVEPSMTARKLAASAIKSAPFPIEFAGLNGETIELPDAAVDVVTSFLCLCTIPDAGKALREIRRILKPNGKFLFMEHGASPDAPVLKWQNRLNGMQNMICGGCNLNRRISEMIDGSKLSIDALENRYIPGMPKPMGYAYIGCAKKPIS